MQIQQISAQKLASRLQVHLQVRYLAAWLAMKPFLKEANPIKYTYNCEFVHFTVKECEEMSGGFPTMKVFVLIWSV